MAFLRIIFAISILVLAQSSSVFAQSGLRPVPELNRVVWVWLENVSYSQMQNEPYVRSLLKIYPSARFTSYSRVSEVTQGNTFALLTGSDQGVPDNNLTRLFVPTLVDLLEAKNIPWKVYAEDFPGACYLNSSVGNYQRYRVPFLSIAKVQSDRFQCMKILNYANLADDVKTGNVAQFSFVTPNAINSGALGSSSLADTGLKKVIAPILSNADWASTTTFIITSVNMDAARADQGFMMIFGNGVADGAYSIPTAYNHYSLLRTLEDGLSLGNLNQADSKASPILGFWK